MQDSLFGTWLANRYRTRAGTPLTQAAQRDALSRCRRVEQYEGDLDEHYRRDQMRRLIERFEYTSAEAERGARPAHSVPISGDVRSGTASLKNAILLYRAFIEK